ncbi:MAG: hypothetical protein Q8M03_17095 [Legionella sp.]|nr:hypothetical protein [Legionella sp.]
MAEDSNIPFDLTFSDLIGRQGMDNARLLYAVRDEENKLPTKAIHNLRAFLPILLTYYSDQLDQMNPAIFAFLTDDQKINYTNQLKFTYYLFYAQYQLDKAEHRRRALADYTAAMNKCSKFLDQLDLSTPKPTPEELLLTETSASEKYLKFCGLTIIAPYVVQKIMAFIDSKAEVFGKAKTVITKEIMTDINGVRLYWVWGGGLLSSVLEMLPANFFNAQQAQIAVNAPNILTGYISWVLYYARFGINLMLLLKHTIKGPWMSIEESKIPWQERFKTQWDKRKFALLNDSIWATANMACFFWLTGAGMLGYFGNFLTAGLLIMDLTLTIWRFWEESTKHAAKMLQFGEIQTDMEEKLEHAKIKLDRFAPGTGLQALIAKPGQINELKQEILELEHKLADNKKLKNKMQSEWQFKRYNTLNDLAYAAGLLMAFCLMYCFFCPPFLIAPAVLAIIGLAGAALCFVLTVVNAAVTGALDVTSTRRASKEAREECEELLVQFKKTDDVNIKKQLYLQMEGLMAQSDYHQKMVHFHAIKLVRSVLIDALAPAIIFTALVFMPLGIGLTVVAAAIALAILSKILLNQFKPAMGDHPSFDNKLELEFEAFNSKREPALSHFDKKKGHSFFAQNNYSPLPADCRGDDSENFEPEHSF